MKKLRFILILICCGIFSLEGSQSTEAASHTEIKPRINILRIRRAAPEDYKNFDTLYQDVLRYQALNQDFQLYRAYSPNKKIYSLEKEKKVVSELISLSGNNLSRFLQKDPENPQALSPLEELYYENLGDIAEEICEHFSKTTELPPEISLLRQIYLGQTVEITKDYSEAFLKVAYRVANQANNYPMVDELYSISGVQEIFEKIKESSPAILSSELNYIHEPYWLYNIVQLKAYGGRIIEKLKSYFISEEQVIEENEVGTFILSQDEKIPVRKVRFGYVLPNLYLKKRLDNNERLGVPRIFILPKDKNSNFIFTFLMPYSLDGTEYIETGNMGFNPLQVFCNDFVIYQEFIEGTGTIKDRTFFPYGQVDFNAVQVITSKSSRKKFLVDTKEQKNFFMPYLSPFTDFDPSDVNLKGIIEAYGNKEMPEEKNERKIFESWKKEQQRIIFRAKSLNFDPREMYVKVQVGLQ